MMETHETRIVTLNKQLADKCVEFVGQSKDLAKLKEQLSSLQSEVTQLRDQERELINKLGSLSEKVCLHCTYISLFSWAVSPTHAAEFCRDISRVCSG